MTILKRRRSIAHMACLVPLAIICTSCGKQTQMSIQPFGKTPDGQEASLVQLVNPHGMQADITNYGGIVTRLRVPDRHGRLDDVVLGFDTLDEYIKQSPYFGAIVGRYGNRIAHGRFTLDGVEYKLATNDGQHHLHGGNRGFDKITWEFSAFQHADMVGVRLCYISRDGEEGYPGSLGCTITYTLTPDNALRIDYLAGTDKPTPVNLSHHGYFNLAGQGNGDILGHKLWINADRFIPVDRGLIPTGELAPVQGTPFDFLTRPMPIGSRIDSEHPQLANAGGYDHTWVLNKQRVGELSLAATVYEPTTGRVMNVLTTEPGLQFYSGNFLDGKLTRKEGKVYGHRAALCLEAQHFPDSPNQPGFPSVILREKQKYTQTTIYQFRTR